MSSSPDRARSLTPPPLKRKRASSYSQTTVETSQQSSIFDESFNDSQLSALDAPESPLSSVPDGLSDCSEARQDKRLKTDFPRHGDKSEISVPVEELISEPLCSAPQASFAVTSPACRQQLVLNRSGAAADLVTESQSSPPLLEPECQPESASQVDTAPDSGATLDPLSPPEQLLSQDQDSLALPVEPKDWHVPVVEYASTQQDHAVLLGLAQELAEVAKVSRNLKSEPRAQPPVWADGRQPLCETLRNFRSYHSGCYASNGFVHGIMLDKEAHCRDYLDTTVIISRAGGGLIADKITGEYKAEKDQDYNSKTNSLRNSMQYLNPVMIITGEHNPCMPCKPPHVYCVLDYFKPTHIWFEKTNNKRVLRYRFEKLNTNEESWWKAKEGLNAEDICPLGSLESPIVKKCAACKQTCAQVYIQPGWMCLNPACESFWQIEDGTEPEETELLYDPRFLKQKTVWPNDNHRYALAPNVPESSGKVGLENNTLAYWQGIVCPSCGRCLQRLSWLGWECEPCGFKRHPPHSFVPPQALHDPYYPLTSSYSLSRDTHKAGIVLSVAFKDNYRINMFSFPGIESGFVAHLIANKTINEAAGGPDDMFAELQNKDIGLRRRNLPSGMLKGESVCRHFTSNFGMPYKFIAAASSMPFEGAADAINNTRSLLNWASWMISPDTHQEFNEVLALAYFEDQKISYHDDGEFGLGPTIATLSLGATGYMRLRMKEKHYNGVSKGGIYNVDKPLPGGKQYEARLAAYEELQTLKKNEMDSIENDNGNISQQHNRQSDKLSDETIHESSKKKSSKKSSKGSGRKGNSAYRAKLESLPRELGLTTVGKAPESIHMTLGHGDIVIMHGEDIQKYYEHSVDHAGKLRFALTCRHIQPHHLKPDEQPPYTVEPDIGNYDGSKLPCPED